MWPCRYETRRHGVTPVLKYSKTSILFPSVINCYCNVLRSTCLQDRALRVLAAKFLEYESPLNFCVSSFMTFVDSVRKSERSGSALFKIFLRHPHIR